MDILIACVLVSALIAPYALLKAFEIAQRKKNKRWSKDNADVVDNWKFPSNY